ncbi:ABC transporter permease [Actinorugispora endophytica]|uniref:ABC transporter permease n=1 Tax=Actinorugispora endophytica TaxID=1605990 RepID=UPI001415232A|nr:ABC transporter permease [Actinorugispora endophytica]
MTGVLGAEWVKVRSVRSFSYVLAGAAMSALLMAALAWYSASLYDGLPDGQRAGLSVTSLVSVIGLPLQICFGVFGVLVVTSEYATGTIRSSLVAVPRRWPVLAAKAAVVAAVSLAAGLAAATATFFSTRAIAGERPMGFNEVPLSEGVPELFAAAAAVAAVALAGAGLGAVSRSTAGSVIGVVVLVYVLPIVALNLPEPWSERVSAVLLPGLVGQVSGVLSGTLSHALLSPPQALAVLALYAAVPLGAAALALRCRDA